MSPPNLANHAATIEQLPDGTILLAWFSGIKEEADKCAIAFSRLPAGSAQWTPPVIVSERDGFSNQNPVLFYDATTRTTWLYHSQLQAGAGEGLDNLWVLQSGDGGLSWSKPAVFLDMSGDKKGIFDRNRIIPRADGSLLFPLYWTTKGPPNAPFMLISDRANHSSWGKPCVSARKKNVPSRPTTAQNTPLPPTHHPPYPRRNRVDVKNADNLVQPTVVRTAPGTLTAFFRDRKAKSVFGASSSDEGLTWTTPSPKDAGGLPNNNAGIEAFQLASGKTILIFNNSTKDRTPLTAALSKNGGASWVASRNLQVHDDNSTNTNGVEYSCKSPRTRTPRKTRHETHPNNHPDPNQNRPLGTPNAGWQHPRRVHVRPPNNQVRALHGELGIIINRIRRSDLPVR